MTAPTLGALVTNSKVYIGFKAGEVFRPAAEYPRSRSRYMPHQGEKQRIKTLRRFPPKVVDVLL